MAAMPGGNETLPTELMEKFEFLALTLSLTLLIGALGLSYAVERRFPRSWFPEAALFLFMGMVLGGAMRLVDSSAIGRGVEKFASFDTNLFFVVLLPPIIFNSGYQMRRDVFMRNFGPICALAFAGTLVSSLIVGSVMYAASSAGLVFDMGGLDCLVFGSLISATDPVTVLVVFQRLGVDPDLYSLVFGESVLNDAVAIVLYRTFVGFEVDSDGVTFSAVLGGVGTFLGIFVGSFMIGVIFGMASALFFKHVHVGRYHESVGLERAFALLVPYMPYCLAEGLRLSGIVAILFCGMTMASYTLPNLSAATRRFSLEAWSTVATASEAFVFVYLGVALFTADEEWSGTLGFTVVAIGAVMLGRLVNVYPIVAIVNKLHERAMVRRRSDLRRGSAAPQVQPRIGRGARFALWFSGLRGGIAFALSTAAEEDLANAERARGRENGRVMETATILITVITVVVCGTLITPLVTSLGLLEPEAERRDAGEGGIELTTLGSSPSHQPNADFERGAVTGGDQLAHRDAAVRSPSFSQLALRLATTGDSSALSRLDAQYIRPFLCVAVPDVAASEVGGVETRTSHSTSSENESIGLLSSSGTLEQVDATSYEVDGLPIGNETLTTPTAAVEPVETSVPFARVRE